jgi:hypothetical protein
MLSELQRLYFSNGEGWVVAGLAAIPLAIAVMRLSLQRAISVGLISSTIVLAHHVALSVIGLLMLNPITLALLAPSTPRPMLEVAAERLSIIAVLLPALKIVTAGMWVVLVVWACVAKTGRGEANRATNGIEQA